MLIHLAPGFKSPAHTAHVLEFILNQISCRVKTAIAMIAIDNHWLIFGGILNKVLNVSIMKVQRARYVRRLVGARIANINECAFLLIEHLFGFANLDLWNLVHGKLLLT